MCKMKVVSMKAISCALVILTLCICCTQTDPQFGPAKPPPNYNYNINNNNRPNVSQYNPGAGHLSSIQEQPYQKTCTIIKGRPNVWYSRSVKKDDPLVYEIFVERSYFADAHNTNLRIELDVDKRSATLQNPVLFSVGQKRFISTFELPHALGPENERLTYYSAGRNLCIQRKGQVAEGQNITVRVSTSSLTNAHFRFQLKLTNDFQIGLGKPITLDISPTSPRYFGFQSFTPDMSVIKIRATSETEMCMTLSVQTPQCPIYDREVNVKHQGLWQTMTVQAAMTVELTNRFKDGFVVALVAHESDKKCSKSSYINPYEPPPIQGGPIFGSANFSRTEMPRIKMVTIQLSNESSVSGWLVFLAMFIPVFWTVILILLVACLFKNRHEWLRVETEQKLKPFNQATLLASSRSPPTSLSVKGPSLEENDGLILSDLRTLPTPVDETSPSPNQDRNSFVLNGEKILSPTTRRPPCEYLRAPIERFYEMREDDGSKIQWKADLAISDFVQKDPVIMHKNGRRFYWVIVIVAIFYCIPVYQLILHYLRVLYRTGEYDICYYNYLCAHRLGLFIDFNHFWSNASYIIFGFAFIFFVGRRATATRVLESYAMRKRARKTSFSELEEETEPGFCKRTFGYSRIYARPDHGIPQNWGIFYALGIALAMEGVLSAAYHLCPNQSSFQFDTCFMYVIAVLILLKIYQFRHSVHFGADHTFLILAAFVLFSVVGLMMEFQGTQARQIYRWCFIALQFVTTTLLSIYLYALGYVRSQDNSKFLTNLKIVFNLGQLKDHRIKGDRLVLPVISFLFGIAVLVYCEIENIDFATYLLYVLVSNVIGTTLYYVGIMKPLHGEFKNRTWVQPCIYFVGAGVIGGFAVRYFVRSPAAWELTAAASRAENEECMTGWFPFYAYYDSHDAWHFLSAAALFLSFMALLIVDDDLMTTPQSRIPVF